MHDPLRYFEYDHLRDDRAREMSKMFYALAYQLVIGREDTNDDHQVIVALHLLLLAKDAAVRSVLP